MKKKISLSLIMFTLCVSIFIGGCSCGKEEKPKNPNANVILANSIILDKNEVTDAKIGESFEITYIVNPASTTDPTVVIKSSDNSIATIDKTEGTSITDTITVTPVGVGTVNIIFTWSGIFDNDFESENRTITKATKVFVVGETGKETLNQPTNLNYKNGKFTWDAVSYGKTEISETPNYELVITGGASPIEPITIETNEYEFPSLTSGVEYTAKVKAKPSGDLQNFYTESAFTEEIKVYKLAEPSNYKVNNGVVTWDKVEKANKYIVNVNGVDKKTITANDELTFSYDAKADLIDDVYEANIKVKAVNDSDPLIFDGDFSVNTAVVHRIKTPTEMSISHNPENKKTTVNWAKPEFATKYTLELQKSGDENVTKYENIDTNSFEIPVELNGVYSVRVKAFGDETTIESAFTEFYQISTLYINLLDVQFEGKKVTYNYSGELLGNKIEFTILNSGSPVVISKTEPTGTFNINEEFSSYILQARIVATENSGFISSESKTFGHEYLISLQNKNETTSELVWNSIKGALGYTLEITKPSGSETVEVEAVETNLIKYEIPLDYEKGEYQVKVKVNMPNELTNEFGSVFIFNKLDISTLSATLVDGVINYNIVDLQTNKIEFTIKNSGVDKKVVVTENTGTVTIADHISTNSYIVSVRLVGNIDTGFISSDSKNVGEEVLINLVNKPDYKTELQWDKISSAVSYTIQIESNETKEFVVDVIESDKIVYEVPADLVKGEYIARVKVNLENNVTTGYGKDFAFTKLDESTIQITFIGNVLKFVDADVNINKIVVSVPEAQKNYELEKGQSIDFKEENLKANDYTISIQGISTTNTKFVNTNVLLTEHSIKVVKNPIITSVSKEGLLNWELNENYTNYKVIIDKDNADQQTHETASNSLNVSGLKVGIHDAYIEATPNGDILIDNSEIQKFEFTQLDSPKNIRLENGKIVWDSILDNGGYEVTENEKEVAVVETEEFTPTLIKDSNIYIIKALGNGTTTISGKITTSNPINKVTPVADLTAANGRIKFTREEGVTYKTFVNDEEVLDIEKHNFSGLNPYEDITIYVKSFKPGYFDSDNSDILRVKKLGIATGIKISSTDKTTYTISWDLVQDANSYIVMYNGANYPVDTNSLAVDSALPTGEYEIKIIATYMGEDLKTDVTGSFGYVVGDESEAYKFQKLATPTNIAIVNGVLVWENPSTLMPISYKISYTLAEDENWQIIENDDTTTNSLSSLVAGTYKIKIVAIGDNLNLLSSDESEVITIVKTPTISNFKVLNGEIVWDPIASDGASYVYDVYVYTKSQDVLVPFGEPTLNYTETKYSIPNIAPDTEYKLKVVAKNSEGVELYSDESSELTVVKLETPKNFGILNSVARWRAVQHSGVVATNDYRIRIQSEGLPEGLIDTTEGTVELDLLTTEFEFVPKTIYNISVMAKGTEDSTDTMKGYLNSDYTDSKQIYKLAEIQNLRIEDGIIKWDITHTPEDLKQPEGFELSFSRFEIQEGGEVVTHTKEISLPRNSTSFDMKDFLAGQYKLDFLVKGNGTVTLSSKVVILGETGNFVKLQKPTGLRMEKGVLTWDTEKENENISYILYNDGQELITKTNDDRTYAPDTIVNTNFNISIKATLEGAVYSEISDSIKIRQLSQVRDFKIENQIFKWTKVENAEGYVIVITYEEPKEPTPPEENGGDVPPSEKVNIIGAPTEGEQNGENGEGGDTPAPETPKIIEILVKVDGGNTTTAAIPGDLPLSYKVKEVYALGNTTVDINTLGYFNSIPVPTTIDFRPIDKVNGLTVKEGSFVWNKVEGANYYSIEFLKSTDELITKSSSVTNTFKLNNDKDFPAGEYKIKVTPISTNDQYLTTNVGTVMTFNKKPQLTNIRIENGYIAWNVLKEDILKAYKIGKVEEKPEEPVEPPKEPTEKIMANNLLVPKEPGEGGEPEITEPVYNQQVFDEFYRVAVGEYKDDAMTAAMYSLAYIEIELQNEANNRSVIKTVKPFNVVDEADELNYVTCYYFLDVEQDVWKFKIKAKGNTVHIEDQKTIKYINGVNQTEFIKAAKLSSPLCPVHPDVTAISDGILRFTPVRKADGTLYTKYILEAIPVDRSKYKIITKIIEAKNLDENIIFNIKELLEPNLRGLKLETDIKYDLKIKTLGTEDSSLGGEFFLNSNTPITTAMTILGKLTFTVNSGVLTWNQSPADSYKVNIKDLETGKVYDEISLPAGTLEYNFGEEYPANSYEIVIQAIGDGINKISSEITTFKVVKNDALKQDQVLVNEGSFTWKNLDETKESFYTVEITANDGVNEPTISGIDVSVEKGEKSVLFELPENYPSSVNIEGITYRYKYSIRVMFMGDLNSTEQSAHINSDYSLSTYEYQRLATPKDLRVKNGKVVWNSVAGASSYHVFVTGTIIVEGLNGTEEQQIEMEENVGSLLEYDLKGIPGVYDIKVRACGSTPNPSTPANAMLTSAYSEPINVVKVVKPELRLERGEIVWNNDGMPFAAAELVKVTINGTEIIYKNDVNDNISIDLNDPKYVDGAYTVTVQLLGSNEVKSGLKTRENTDEPGTEGPVEPQPEPQPDIPTKKMFYIGSDPVSISFNKLKAPQIELMKKVFDGDETNILKWNKIDDITVYDVYVKTKKTIIIEDDPKTEDIDESQTIVEEIIDIYKSDDPNYLTAFGTMEGNQIYFKLSTVPYEDYEITVRAVGNDINKSSSSSSNSIHVHVPRPPKNLRYNAQTGVLSWENVTEDSDIVLEIKKNGVEVYPGGKVLPKGTTEFRFEEIGEYKIRIKSRLTITGGNYDSDYLSKEPLTANFNLFSQGKGTPSEPYIIKSNGNLSSKDQLNNIRYYPSSFYRLDEDVRVDGPFDIIGGPGKPFTGGIDGQNHIIKTLRYDFTSSYNNLGLIYQLGEDKSKEKETTPSTETAVVKNLKVVYDVVRTTPSSGSGVAGISVKTANFGGIAIVNNGHINNVQIEGTINIDGLNLNRTYFGGVATINNGKIENAINRAVLDVKKDNANNRAATCVGGIAARNNGSIIKSGNEGILIGQFVGGIASENYYKISESYNVGSLKAVTDGYADTSIKVGGIAADNAKLYNTAKYGMIENCYVIMLNDKELGNTSVLEINNGIGDSKPAIAGGIVGNDSTGNSNTITNCYVLLGTYKVSGSAKVSAIAGVVTKATAIHGVMHYSAQSQIAYHYGSSLTKVETNAIPSSLACTKVDDVKKNKLTVGTMVLDEITNLPKFAWQDTVNADWAK